MTSRRILLVDADAFFVAVARQVDPEGAGKAKLLIVGGSPDSRGVVCSASYETRAFGVRSAMPMSRAVRLCPQALCVPVPRKACGEQSRAIADVLAGTAPIMQASSIDEWYLDLGGTEALFGHEPLAETARKLRQRVMERTGLSVSIGGGTSKLVAKLAVELAKPKPGTGATGVHIVEPGDEGTFMTRFALGELPFVGPRFQQRLERFAMRTVTDALAHDEPTLVRMLGEREGRWLWRRVRGIDDSPVAPREEAKSMGREETFPRDLHDDAALERELLRLVEAVGSDVRGDGVRARTITVKIKDTDFTQRQAGRTLSRAVETDGAIWAVARELLGRLRRARRVGARLVGITLSQFADTDRPEQLTLFGDAAAADTTTPEETDRDRRLARTVDAIRERFGRTAIGRAAAIEPD
jgi:DNA polymerase-4